MASDPQNNPRPGDLQYDLLRKILDRLSTVGVGAAVALGTGSTATMGKVGGAGPATATQNTWLQLKDSTGATVWVPAWK